MARPKAKAPARSYHLSGQSIVRINGQDFYLGKHDSPESIAHYAVLIGTYQAGGMSLPDGFDIRSTDAQVAFLLGQIGSQAVDQTKQPILVRHVTAAFREHSIVRYANSRAELHKLDQVCDELDKHDGDTEAVDFGPVKLQVHRKRWIAHGYARKYCNRLTNIVVRIFKYAVSQELIEETTHRRLKSVEPLREGQTTAQVRKGVRYRSC